MRQASFFLLLAQGTAPGLPFHFVPHGLRRASDDAFGNQVTVPAFCGGHTMAVEVSGGGLLPTVQQFCSVVGSYHCAEDLWR